MAAGTYTVTAKAYDDRNASTVSSAVVITVGQNAMPTISLSSPPANSTAAAPATLALAATTTGSVTKVEFYSGQTLIGTATTPPYTLVWNNVPAGDYTLTAIASNDQGQQVTSPPISVSVIANQPLTIALTSPTPGQSFTLPTTVNLLAEAAGPDNGIAKVEFFAGTTLIGTVLTPPYSHAWENVPAGTYVITARATDALGAQTTTAPITITVANTVTKPSVVYLHVDHLNTPKLATDEQGKIIWRNSPLTEPFGNSPVEEDPDNDGIPFTLNLRFPGQYFDQETNTHYNYFRDYDPLTGRFVQSDPIGLAGGSMSLYTYADNAPTMKVDPLGLASEGGPYHPPEGVSLRCDQSDTCPQIEGKMQQLKRMIDSHQGWDWNNPRPRGGNRHATEIAELWRAYGRCQAVWERKCKSNCPPPEGESGFSKWWRDLTSPRPKPVPDPVDELQGTGRPRPPGGPGSSGPLPGPSPIPVP